MTSGAVFKRLEHRAKWAWRESSSHIRRLPRRGHPEQPLGNPIFVVGCGHSGTTLLLSILAAHSTIHGIPYESDLAFTRPSHVDWFVRMFNKDAAAAGATRWVEKTPRHIQRIGRILDRFPTARVIVIVRDGRDVACSIRDRYGDIGAGAERWVTDNSAADAFVDHSQVTTVRYEDLVSERKATLRCVMDFIGEPFEPILLTHNEFPFQFYGRYPNYEDVVAEIEAQTAPPETVSGADHRLYRSWQARQPMFDGRHRWQSGLSADEKVIVKAVAGERLLLHGYTTDEHW